jgi:3'(2'), 5'-bisphosphate nucleotidase
MNTTNPLDLLTLAARAALRAGREILDVYAGPDFAVETKSDQTPLTQADRRAHLAIAEELAATGLPVLSEEGRDIPYQERRVWPSFWLVDPLDGTKEFIKKNDEFTVNIALIREGAPVLGIVLAPALDVLYAGCKDWGAYRIDQALEREASWAGSLARAGTRLPLERKPGPYRIVASRSHLTPETLAYVEDEKKRRGEVELVSIGSSLKLGLVAEGSADIYPRLGPTMEWDIAAGDAVARAAGCRMTRAEDGGPLVYNKENLLNPSFIVRRGD